MRRIIGFIPVNVGGWSHAHEGSYGGDFGEEHWRNIYFLEAVIDFSDLPENCKGKFLIEFKDDLWEEKQQRGRIGVRLAYQDKPGHWVGIKGSEIYTDGGARWLLGKSEWFPMPKDIPFYKPFNGCCLLWIQGMQVPPSDCVVAMGNLVLAVEE